MIMIMIIIMMMWIDCMLMAMTVVGIKTVAAVARAGIGIVVGIVVGIVCGSTRTTIAIGSVV